MFVLHAEGILISSGCSAEISRAEVTSHTEVLYVMELIGLLLIWTGYRYNISPQLSGEDARRVEAARKEALATS